MTVGEMKIQYFYGPLPPILVNMVYAFFFIDKYNITIFILQQNRKLVLQLST
jgi:hypothetical protein